MFDQPNSQQGCLGEAELAHYLCVVGIISHTAARLL